ncbi:MAG: hypothetical protein WDZ44_01425 [Candidatus Spechtbacterales bacterium]
MKMKTITNRLQLWHLLPLALIALVGVAAFVWVERGQFAQNKVVLTVEGPLQMDGGSKDRFTVRLANNSGTALTDAHIAITLPKELRSTKGESSLSFTTESISEGESFVEDVELVATSAETRALIEARADYSPQGVNARFITRALWELTIGSLDAEVSLLVPSTAYAGDEIEGAIRVKPNISFAQTILYARLDVPAGFEVTRVEPEFSNAKDKTWKLGALNENEEREVKFWGVWNKKEKLDVAASIGKYEGIRFLPLHIEEGSIEVSQLPIVTQIRLAQDQTFAYRNDIASFELIVTNQGEEVLRDVVPSIAGTQSFIAFSDTETGSPATSFEWDARTVPALLEIGAGGQVVIPFFAFVDVPRDVQIQSLSIEASAHGTMGVGNEVSDSSVYELSVRKNLNDE